MVILGYRFDTPGPPLPADARRSWRVLALAAKNLVRSRIGRAWMAVRDMDMAAAVIGIPILRTKLLAFARQLLLLRRRRRALGVRLSRHRSSRRPSI